MNSKFSNDFFPGLEFENVLLDLKFPGIFDTSLLKMNGLCPEFSSFWKLKMMEILKIHLNNLKVVENIWNQRLLNLFVILFSAFLILLITLY